MIRSFIAIDITSQEPLDLISSFQKTLRSTGADLKPVPPENVHITLRFLGDIAPSLAHQIGKNLSTLCFDSFEVSLQGAGAFPNMRRINVVWVGIKRGVINLVDIYRQVESRLQELGIRPDTRGFSPHVTVARVRSARNKGVLTKAILAMKNEEFGTFSINLVRLKKSVLTPKGPQYTTLREVSATATDRV